MGVEAASAQGPVTGRVPASTIRALQLFFPGLRTRADMAAVFDVHERTVLGWEQRGAVPDSLPIDPTARDPDWRRNLLIRLIENYEKSGVTDNRKKQQEGDVDGRNAVGALRES